MAVWLLSAKKKMPTNLQHHVEQLQLRLRSPLAVQASRGVPQIATLLRVLPYACRSSGGKLDFVRVKKWKNVLAAVATAACRKTHRPTQTAALRPSSESRGQQ